jgi:hypothetical protein
MKPYNQIDELFASKLRDKQATPPPALWDKLEEQLPGQTRKPFAYWYYAAASVVLLILALAGGWAGYEYRNAEMASAMPKETIAPATEATPLASLNTEALKEPLQAEGESIKIVEAAEESPTVKQEANVPAQTTSPATPKVTKIAPVQRATEAAPLLVHTEQEQVVKQPLATEMNRPLAETPHLAVHVPTPKMEATQQPEPRQTITVEIRSGSAPAPGNELLAMADRNDAAMADQDQPHKKVGRFIKKLNDLRNGEEEEVEEFRQIKENFIGQLLNKADKK